MSIPFVRELTDENFDAEVTEAAGPVLVDFYTTRCDPCRMLAPVIDELGVELAGKVKVCKMDAKANPRIAVRMGLMVVPTVIIFKAGRPVASLRGGQTKQRLIAELNRVA